MKRFASLLFAAAVLVGCAPQPQPPVAFDVQARWDGNASGAVWTEASLAALDDHGQTLVNTVPADIDVYCPGYRDADATGRKAFWVNLISALAWHESTHRPTAAGGGGRWIGLTQIAPGTARSYGCNAKDVAGLKDGGKNLACAIRIMAVTVPRDGVISQNMRGVAADWGPFHQARKRADIQAWTRSRPECRA